MEHSLRSVRYLHSGTSLMLMINLSGHGFLPMTFMTGFSGVTPNAASRSYHGRRRVNALLTRTGAARGRRIVHAGGLLNAFPLRASSVRDRFTTQSLGPWATQSSLTESHRRALVGSRPPLGDVWHAASGASQTSLRSTLNFAQNQERGLAACKTLANLPAALVVDQQREQRKASIL